MVRNPPAINMPPDTSLECLSLASSIQDFSTFEIHKTFASRLHAKHGRKTGFWAQVAELSGSRR
jgi:hypothetical protein